MRLDLPRTGKGYKEGAALLEEEVVRLWRIAAQAVADGFPRELPDGSRRDRAIRARDFIAHPELPAWPEEDWAAGPLGPVYKASRNYTHMTSPLRKLSRRP